MRKHAFTMIFCYVKGSRIDQIMRYQVEGVFMEALIWANEICNAKFDWFSRKETKSTYEKQPFSEEKPQDRVNPLFSPNFRNEERKR